SASRKNFSPVEVRGPVAGRACVKWVNSLEFHSERITEYCLALRASDSSERGHSCPRDLYESSLRLADKNCPRIPIFRLRLSRILPIDIIWRTILRCSPEQRPR